METTMTIDTLSNFDTYLNKINMNKMTDPSFEKNAPQ